MTVGELAASCVVLLFAKRSYQRRCLFRTTLSVSHVFIISRPRKGENRPFRNVPVPAADCCITEHILRPCFALFQPAVGGLSSTSGQRSRMSSLNGLYLSSKARAKRKMCWSPGCTAPASCSDTIISLAQESSANWSSWPQRHWNSMWAQVSPRPPILKVLRLSRKAGRDQTGTLSCEDGQYNHRFQFSSK